jgi:hypothetical protein
MSNPVDAGDCGVDAIPINVSPRHSNASAVSA